MGYITEASIFYNYHYVEGFITFNYSAEIVGLAFQ